MPLFGSSEQLVKEAEEIAKQLGKVKTHQLRRIYSQVSSIYHQSEQNFGDAKSRLVLLKPQLAYAKSRNPHLKPLTERLINLIGQVRDDTENLKEFYQFVQSVVAYHKEERREER